MQRTILRQLARFVAFLALTAVLAGAARSVIPADNVGPDFIQFYAAGTLLASREDPYDPKLQAQVQRSLGWKKADEGLGLYDFMPYYYPPWLGLAAALLVPLGYPLAKMTWIVLAGEALVAGALLLRDTIRTISAPLAVGVVVLFGFSIKSAAMGQIAPFVLFLAALAWWLLDRRKDGLAGMAIAMLTIKPQLTLLAIGAVLVWCVRQRRLAVVGGFAATLAVLAAASTLAYPGWLPSMLSATNATPMPTRYFPGIGTTWYSVLDAVGLEGIPLVTLSAVVGAVFVVAVMEIALRRETTLAELFGLALVAPFFVVPYARAYDFPVLLVPALALVGASLTPLLRGMLVATLTILVALHIAVVTTNWQPAIVGVRRDEFTYFWVPALIAFAWLLAGHREPARVSAELPDPLETRSA